MTTKLSILAALVCGLAAAQQPQDRPQEETRLVNEVESAAPASPVQPRRSVWDFALEALNPRQIRWGDELDRRLAELAEHSAGNPYFRLCAVQAALNLILLLISWLWWDKARQIKWVAAEALAEAINAQRMADAKAFEAIDRHNRHIELCNRVIEAQESGVGADQPSDDAREKIRDLQTQLAAERANGARLEAEAKRRNQLQPQLERRIEQLESRMRDGRDGANAELLARLERAESQLANRYGPQR